MIENDFDNFSQAWSGAFELCSRGRSASPAAINLAFEALSAYPLDRVTQALTRHIRDPDAGRFGLTVADVVLQLDGPKPTADQVLAAAMKPTTPLGVLCRIEIGSWNLGNLNNHQLKPYAEQCLARLDEWRARLAANDLAPHELDAMKRLGVEMGNRRALTAHQPRNTTSAPQLTESAA